MVGEMTSEGGYMKQIDRVKADMHFIEGPARLDPNRGVLVHTVCWRPRPGDPNPEFPGEKAHITTYHLTRDESLCPCGSGWRFDHCCQKLPYWQPVCLNPDMQGYSLVQPISIRFTNIPADAIYTALQDDERLYCIEDTPQRVFWLYWGKPAFEIPQGTLSFGDIQLLEGHTLLISTLSNTRMQMLLELMHPFKLGIPQIKREPPSRQEKPAQKVLSRKRRRKS
jgi:hypothetical protein